MRGIVKVVIGGLIVLAVIIATSLILNTVLSRTTTAGVTPAAVSRTYSNAAFRFSVTYDRRVFMAIAARPVPRRSSLWPGVGLVDGASQLVAITVNGPVSLQGVLVDAWRPRHAAAMPTLAQFTRRLRGQLPANVHLVGSPRAVALNGVPAVRYTVRIGTAMQTQYDLWHAPFIYAISYKASTRLWPSLAPRMSAVAQSFTVTP